jgi:hypothetical protein
MKKGMDIKGKSRAENSQPQRRKDWKENENRRANIVNMIGLVF